MKHANQNEQITVDGILREIEEKANTGERNTFSAEANRSTIRKPLTLAKYSSNLYRVFLEAEDFDVESEHFDIEAFQRAMLSAANKFSLTPVSEIERLAEIQHFGGKTNLIDFTKDYLIALFMASQESRGRER